MAILNLRPLRIGWPPVLIRSAQGGPDPEPQPDYAPIPLTPPAMTGDTSPTGEIRVIPGTYDARPSARIRWRWQQADAPNGPWTALRGLGTVSSITNNPTLAGKYIRAQEQADNAIGSTSFINPSAASWIGPIEAEAEPDPAGPLRTPTPSLPHGIVLGGHSSLHPSSYDGILAAAVGPVILDFGQSSEELWNNNGPARTRPEYDMLIVSESDTYGEPYYTGIPHPESAEGLNNLQHLYWLGLEAKDRGAEFVIFNSPSARSTPVDDTNRVRMNYYRYWLQTHLDMEVWVLPGELYVQELKDAGYTEDHIFSDQVHLRDGPVSQGAAYQAVAFVTGALPSGIPAEARPYADAALASVQRAWWAGLGGSDFEAGLSIPDPLPNPLPRPGTEPLPSVVEWTANGYAGPALEGVQPVVDGDELVFDGTGLFTNDLPIAGGFYVCMDVNYLGEYSGLASLLTVCSNANNIFENPYFAFELHSSNSIQFSMYGAGPDVEMQMATLGNGRNMLEFSFFEGELKIWNGAGYDVIDQGASWPSSVGFRLFDTITNIRSKGIFVSTALPSDAERISIRQKMSNQT